MTPTPGWTSSPPLVTTCGAWDAFYGRVRGGGRLSSRLPTTSGLARARPEVRAGSGRAIHFASVGVASTVTFTLLFVLLYGSLGGLGADVAALALAGAGNLMANRRYTFDGPGQASRQRLVHWLAALPLLATVAVLALAQMAGWSGLPTELGLVTLANLGAAAVRFRLLVAPPPRDG